MESWKLRAPSSLPAGPLFLRPSDKEYLGSTADWVHLG
jgi:hypothetical protein